MQRHGLTLFEVLFSALLITLTGATVLLLLPRALRTQEQARFQLYATAQTLSLVEHFNCHPLLDAPGSELLPTTNPDAAGVQRGSPWDVPFAYWGRNHDLDTRMWSRWSGMLPVPTSIARRLDSDNDEIRTLLDGGGQLYYANPVPDTGQAAAGVRMFRPPNEARRLVFGVVGYAQQNAMPALPWKSWPYYAWYPSPPEGSPEEANDPLVKLITSCVMDPEDTTLPSGMDAVWLTNGNGWILHDGKRAGFRWYRSTYHRNPPVPPGGSSYDAAPPRAEDAVRYVAVAYRHAAAGVAAGELPRVFLDGGEASDADIEQALGLGSGPAIPAAARGRNVNRVRFLAHAAACLTRHFRPAATARIPVTGIGAIADPTHTFTPANLLKGVMIAATVFDVPSAQDTSDGLRNGCLRGPGGEWLSDPETKLPLYRVASRVAYRVQTPSGWADVLSPEGTFPRLTHDQIVNHHRNCLRLAMAFAARFPDDWSAPRPANRSIMTDVPLLQWDVLDRQPLSGLLTGTTVAATQWHPLAMRLPDVSAGYSRSFTMPAPYLAPGEDPATRPLAARLAIPWGDPAHATLTTAFNPVERCRELVAWAVDWQSFEDFETAPGPPLDASLYPLAVPTANANRTWAQRRSNGLWDEDDLARFRNPDRYRTFICDMDNRHPDPAQAAYRPSGDPITTRTARGDRVISVTDSTLKDLGNVSAGQPGRAYWRPDRQAYTFAFSDLTTVDPTCVFNQLHGADRNGNGVLDRGPLPASQRLRATTVTRFIVYDPRLPVTLR